ncbi:MAG: hypothetical protein ACFWUC_05970 [Oscillospiraceae bacterium]|jgi:hypothetical protein
MMYRRLASMLVVCALLLPFPVSAKGSDLHPLLTTGTEEKWFAEQPTAANLAEVSDILIVYPDDLSETKQDSLSNIVECFTFLGYASDYLPQSKAATRLSQYNSLVCYALETSARMETALRNFSGHVLLLGCLPNTLPSTENYPRKILFSETNSAAASYTFSGNNTFSQLLVLDSFKLPEHPTYTAGTLATANGTWPLVSGWNSVRYLPMTDYTTAFARAVLQQEVSLWLWPYQGKPHSYAQYIVIDSVYPFTNPEKLLTVVQNLVEEKISFVISVMPIYQNADFPAMQQFCEILRYAQANSGAVILHAPIVQGELNVQTLQQKLTDAEQSYIQNQVYPVALEIPKSWMYQENLRSTLGRFRTLFVYNDGLAGANLNFEAAVSDFSLLGAQLVSPVIPLDATGAGYLDCCATAVYIDSTVSEEQIMQKVHAARNSSAGFKSLWDAQHIAYFNNGGLLQWNGKTLMINGKEVSLDYEPKTFDENYDYKRTILYRATANLQKGNRVLILFVAAALGILALSMYLARRQMHRRFFYEDNGHEDSRINSRKK